MNLVNQPWKSLTFCKPKSWFSEFKKGWILRWFHQPFIFRDVGLRSLFNYMYDEMSTRGTLKISIIFWPFFLTVKKNVNLFLTLTLRGSDSTEVCNSLGCGLAKMKKTLQGTFWYPTWGKRKIINSSNLVKLRTWLPSNSSHKPYICPIEVQLDH